MMILKFITPFFITVSLVYCDGNSPVISSLYGTYQTPYAIGFPYARQTIQYLSGIGLPNTATLRYPVWEIRPNYYPDHKEDTNILDNKGNTKLQSFVDKSQIANELNRYMFKSPIVFATASALNQPQALQFHIQNQLGQYLYGYANQQSSKHELKTQDGVTFGTYSYLDSNGKLQTVKYTADDQFGFRVEATNLPKSP